MKILFGFILFIVTISLSFGGNNIKESIESTQEAKIETFTFSSDGTDINGKIYLPESFDKEKNLPAIYLIDFTEQHFNVATDEFEKVISAAEALPNTDAVVVTLEEHLDVDINLEAKTEVFQKYYDLYKNMTSYVDVNYTNNNQRTLIARASEAGIVLMALFQEDPASSVFENFVATDPDGTWISYILWLINGDHFPENKENKKLHFSFSATNNRSHCNDLINAINQAEYPWLQFESIEYTSDFENTYPEAFADGIKYVFNNTATGIEDHSSSIPTGYRLEQNYPNPFNPSTTIEYSIQSKMKSEKSKEASDLSLGNITLKIYDILGKEVATLVNEKQAPGNYEVEFFSRGLSSGIYFYKITADNFSKVRKMILIQ